jgi:hypothetical protein
MVEAEVSESSARKPNFRSKTNSAASEADCDDESSEQADDNEATNEQVGNGEYTKPFVLYRSVCFRDFLSCKVTITIVAKRSRRATDLGCSTWLVGLGKRG